MPHFDSGIWDAEEMIFLGRLTLAALLGGLIGLERERSSQAAGLRTHMVVTLGAALMMILSIKIAEHDKGDPARIAAQVVSGIGFLGAGAIMRYGTSIRGLTTAACLWTSAGIGLAAGAGYYAGAALATALTLFATLVVGKLEHKFLNERSVKRVIVVADDAQNVIAPVEAILRKYQINIRELGIERDLRGHKQTVEIMTTCPERCDLESVVKEIAVLPAVDRIDIE